MKNLDLITIGRSSVDLYGGQIGGRLEDMRSFDKYIGGSPTNIACGTARLGMKSAVITGVGDDVPDLIREARAVVATGTHLSHPQVEAAALKALHIAGGTTDTLAALRAVRSVSQATLVCKRGADGAVAITGEVPASLDEGETGPGFPIEVFNVPGAGDGFGLLCDERLGRDALHRSADSHLWVGCPVEWPGSRPLTLEPAIGPDYGGLSEWPRDHVVKVLCFCYPDDDAQMWADHEATIVRLFNACRRNRLEFLLEVIPSKYGPINDDTTAQIIDRFYAAGVYPDWWKLEPLLTDAAWQHTIDAIERNDANTRGIVVLGLGESEEKLADSFKVAARYPLVKGFAVGRTTFAESAAAWMRGELSDDKAIATMADNYRRLCLIWDEARLKGNVYE